MLSSCPKVVPSIGKIIVRPSCAWKKPSGGNAPTCGQQMQKGIGRSCSTKTTPRLMSQFQPWPSSESGESIFSLTHLILRTWPPVTLLYSQNWKRISGAGVLPTWNSSKLRLRDCWDHIQRSFTPSASATLSQDGTNVWQWTEIISRAVTFQYPWKNFRSRRSQVTVQMMIECTWNLAFKLHRHPCSYWLFSSWIYLIHCMPCWLFYCPLCSQHIGMLALKLADLNLNYFVFKSAKKRHHNWQASYMSTHIALQKRPSKTQCLFWTYTSVVTRIRATCTQLTRLLVHSDSKQFARQVGHAPTSPKELHCPVKISSWKGPNLVPQGEQANKEKIAAPSSSLCISKSKARFRCCLSLFKFMDRHRNQTWKQLVIKVHATTLVYCKKRLQLLQGNAEGALLSAISSLVTVIVTFRKIVVSNVVILRLTSKIVVLIIIVLLQWGKTFVCSRDLHVFWSFSFVTCVHFGYKRQWPTQHTVGNFIGMHSRCLPLSIARVLVDQQWLQKSSLGNNRTTVMATISMARRSSKLWSFLSVVGSPLLAPWSGSSTFQI